MQYFSKTFLVAIGMLCASGYAEAQAFDRPEGGDRDGPPPHARKMFQEQDANNDGFVSKQELLKHVESHFAKMDSNGDGKLTEGEMHAFHKSRRDSRGGDASRKKGGRESRGRGNE